MVEPDVLTHFLGGSIPSMAGIAPLLTTWVGMVLLGRHDGGSR